MFKANLVPIRENARELNQTVKKIDVHIEELSQAVRELNRLSYMTEPIRNLRKVQDQLAEQSSGIRQLERVLEAAAGQYQRSELSIIDVCEATGTQGKREQTGYYHSGWVSDFLTETIS